VYFVATGPGWESDVKLYNWQLSPNCRRVRMFVLEKGMDMPEIEEVGATAEHLVPGGQFGLSDSYVKIWPHALVPMLETDDGLQIGEAMAICRFLENEHPEPNLMGRDGRDQACTEMWERRAYDEGMVGATEAFRNAHPAFVDRGLPGSLDSVPQIPALVERGRGRLSRFYRQFDEQLTENRFIAGDRFTVADITALCSIDFAKIVGIPVPQDCPSLARWYEEISARPGAKASV
jgi:glutathione S-transferase